jgi:amidase
MKFSSLALFLANRKTAAFLYPPYTSEPSTRTFFETKTNMALNVMSNDEIMSLDASTLSTFMESGDITAVQLMQATLARVHQLNPTYRAIINLAPDYVLLEKAQQADESPRRGWLHGIPIAIKDLSNVKDFPTTLGGSPLVDHDVVSDTSDDFCQHLMDAGAIVIGKTNTPEHGLGSHTFNSKWGTTINPYSSSQEYKTAGGSSGGAAVAVATRMLCLADGSDMMGSLRNPAAWNNIYSHRPTSGLLGADETHCNPLPFPISTVGPMARTPRDLALLLETMSNHSFDAATVNGMPLEGMKIGWLGDWGGAFPLETGIQELCRHALAKFNEVGVSIQDVKEPLFDAARLWESWTTIRSKIISTTAIDEYGRDAFVGSHVRVKKEFVWEVERGIELCDEQVQEVTAIANQWSCCALDAFEEYDAIALPAAQVWPFDSNLDWPKSIGSTEMDNYHRWMQIVVPGTLGGLPVVTIPAGFGNGGYPMGIQLIGARGNDAKLLTLAKAYHKLTDWPSKQPPALQVHVNKQKTT